MERSFGPGVGAIFLYQLNCDGAENRLVECPSNYNYGVSHYQDVGVRCLINISPGKVNNDTSDMLHDNIYYRNSSMTIKSISYFWVAKPVKMLSTLFFRRECLVKIS